MSINKSFQLYIRKQNCKFCNLIMENIIKFVNRRKLLQNLRIRCEKILNLSASCKEISQISLTCSQNKQKFVNRSQNKIAKFIDWFQENIVNLLTYRRKKKLYIYTYEIHQQVTSWNQSNQLLEKTAKFNKWSQEKSRN